jgi:hypothetical protein
LGMQEARAAFCWGKEKNERLSGKIWEKYQDVS